MLTTLALASAAPAGSTGLSAFVNFMPLILLFAVFYFLLIRPQQQQMKRHRAKVAAVQKGDQVVTGGGLVGKVTRVDETYVDIEVAPNVKVKAVKSMLSDVIDPTTAKPAND